MTTADRAVTSIVPSLRMMLVPWPASMPVAVASEEPNAVVASVKTERVPRFSIRSEPSPVRIPDAVASAPPRLPEKAMDRTPIVPSERMPLSPWPASIPAADVSPLPPNSTPPVARASTVRRPVFAMAMLSLPAAAWMPRALTSPAAIRPTASPWLAVTAAEPRRMRRLWPAPASIPTALRPVRTVAVRPRALTCREPCSPMTIPSLPLPVWIPQARAAPDGDRLSTSLSSVSATAVGVAAAVTVMVPLFTMTLSPLPAVMPLAVETAFAVALASSVARSPASSSAHARPDASASAVTVS